MKYPDPRPMRFVRRNRFRFAYAYQSLSSSVNGTQAEVSRQNLPNDFGLKPNIWLCSADFYIAPHFRHFQWFKYIVMRLKVFFTKAGADFANRLIFLRLTVIACKKERAIDVGPFPFPVVAPDHHQIERVSDPCEIVLFQLKRHVNML